MKKETLKKAPHSQNVTDLSISPTLEQSKSAKLVRNLLSTSP